MLPRMCLCCICEAICIPDVYAAAAATALACGAADIRMLRHCVSSYVCRNFAATELRLLRAAVGTFYDMLALATRTVEQFGGPVYAASQQQADGTQAVDAAHAAQAGLQEAADGAEAAPAAQVAQVADGAQQAAAQQAGDAAQTPQAAQVADVAMPAAVQQTDTNQTMANSAPDAS